MGPGRSLPSCVVRLWDCKLQGSFWDLGLGGRGTGDGTLGNGGCAYADAALNTEYWTVHVSDRAGGRRGEDDVMICTRIRILRGRGGGWMRAFTHPVPSGEASSERVSKYKVRPFCTSLGSWIWTWGSKFEASLQVAIRSARVH